MKLFLLFFAIILAINTQILKTSLTLDFSGGHCRVCGIGQDFKDQNYACSNNYGNWNNGIRTFVNPLPIGHVVHRIEAKPYGKWGCPGVNTIRTTNVKITVAGQEIDTKLLTGNCACDTCDEVKNFVGQNYTLGFPNYNYNTTGNNFNSLRVQALTNGNIICIDRVEVDIYYKPGQCIEVPESYCSGGCGSHGKCVYDFPYGVKCKCDHEWYGPNCQCNIPSYHLKTDHPPRLDAVSSGFENKDELKLHFKNPMKYFNTRVTFKNFTHNTCNYPGSSTAMDWNLAHDTQKCITNFVGRVPWIEAYPKCVFKRTVQQHTLDFEGEMDIYNEEFLGSIPGSNRNTLYLRKIRSRLPFIIQYPRFISLTTESPRIYAAINVDAAIVKQFFQSDIPRAPGSADVEIDTRVQYPFKGKNPSITGPSGQTVSVQLSPGIGCPDQQNTLCTQLWDIQVIPDLNKCNFNGNYTLTFDLECQPSRSGVNCPLKPGEDTVTINFRLESEDFCPKVIENIDLSGALTTYQDAPRTVPKEAFLDGQTIYFKSKLNSNEATIIQTKIGVFDVRFLSDNGTVIRVERLYQNGANTAEGNQVSFSVNDNPGNAEESYASLVVNPSFFQVPLDSSIEVTFFTTVDVTFQNTNYQTQELHDVGLEFKGYDHKYESKALVSAEDKEVVDVPKNQDFSISASVGLGIKTSGAAAKQSSTGLLLGLVIIGVTLIL